MEYKSPGDRLNLGVFYKAQAYAALYKSYEKTAAECRRDDITVSLVRETRPAGLFSDFKKRGVPVRNPYPGIYYVEDRALFPTQIIVTGELEKQNHGWLKALSDRMDRESMRDFLSQVQRTRGKYAQELVDAVWEVNTRANQELVKKLRGDDAMCQAMLEIMEPKFNEMWEELRMKFEEVDRKFEEIDRKSEELNRKSEELDRKSEEVDRKSEEVDQRTEELDRKSEEVDQRTEELNRKSEEVDRKSEEVDRKMEEVDRRSEEAEKVLQEGRKKEAAQTARRLYELNIDIEKIALGIGYTVETVRGWLGAAVNS